MTWVHGETCDTDWLQAGDIHGGKYDLWFRRLNGRVIQYSKGSVTGTWYKQIDGSFRGMEKTKEAAIRKLEREARGKGEAW